jgi:hypothetical protein
MILFDTHQGNQARGMTGIQKTLKKLVGSGMETFTAHGRKADVDSPT